MFSHLPALNSVPKTYLNLFKYSVFSFPFSFLYSISWLSSICKYLHIFIVTIIIITVITIVITVSVCCFVGVINILVVIIIIFINFFAIALKSSERYVSNWKIYDKIYWRGRLLFNSGTTLHLAWRSWKKTWRFAFSVSCLRDEIDPVSSQILSNDIFLKLLL